MSAVGDINGDGYNDIIVGALGSGNADDSDFVFVYSGENGEELYTFHHGHLFEGFGWAVSTGDVNNDGYDDIIIGVPWSDVNSDTVGRVFVFSGQNGDTLYTFIGAAEDDQFGYSVASGGDFNNDGYEEIVVGATYRYATGENESEVYVFSGQTGAVLYVYTSQSIDDLFGITVWSRGDLNNDGFADLVIGAPNNDGNGVDAGRVYAFSGQTGDTLFLFSGESENDFLGQSVAVADINNDNYDDLIIGTGENISPGLCCGAGKVYVLSGLDGDTILVINGKVQDIFGYRVAPAGDVDNDGFTDILVGTPFAYDQVTQIGRT
ncbi:MAG TPA: FG-GAP-like repeat-containing protein, partial [candidate division Zixibacteria bacterium]|nr:FG-GAP-like repeat-containing protein [candidate division Zixibacteria bacterium]